MNQVYASLLLSIFLYALFFNKTLLSLQLLVIGFYSAFALYFRFKSKSTPYIRRNGIFWKDPKDGGVLARLEVDVQNLLKLLAKINKNGEKISLVSVFVKCFGESIKERDLHNQFFFGNLKPNAEPDICVSRKLKGKFEAVQLRSAPLLSLHQITQTLSLPSLPSLETKLSELNFSSRIPTFFLQQLLRLNCFLLKNFSIGLYMPEPQSVMIIYDLTSTNIDDLTLTHNEFNDGILYLTINCVKERPVVIEGKGPDGTDTVEVRPVVFLNHCIDHRYLDGSDGYAFLKRFTVEFAKLEKELEGLAEGNFE